MKYITPRQWRKTIAALSLAVALAAGGITASTLLAETAATLPAAPAGQAPRSPAAESFRKALELFQAEKYAEANVEVDKALKLDPKHNDAQVLKGMIQGKLAEGPGGTPGEGPMPAPGAEKVRLLKQTDINLIRVTEWSPELDTKVAGRIDRKVLEEFWNEVVRKQDSADATSKEAYTAFLNNFSDQVKRIKNSGEAKYMEKINFTSDPHALAVFRTKVHSYVLQNCATAQCHASDKGGNFRLIRPANSAANDQVIYTNFYILSRYTNADGKMIDRDTPEKSLLVQYGMVKSASKKPHPGKVEVRHFVDQNDTKLPAAVEWVKSLKFPPPDYGIVYELPGAKAAPAPVPAPATTPAATTRPAPTRPKPK